MRLGLTAFSLGVCGLVSSTALAATPSDQLVMAWNIDAVSTFDPAEVGEIPASEVIYNTCDTLVAQSPTNESEVVPSLAESWTVSEDGRTVTFKIREGAKFSSGNPVTAEAVAWSMRRTLLLDRRNAGTMRDYGFNVDNMDDAFQVLDERTFQLKLQEPYPVDLILQAVIANRMSMPLDKAFLEEKAEGDDYGNSYLKTKTACSGPYSLRQWNAGEMIVLDANEHYWGQKPAMRRVIIRHIPEPSAQRLLIERGDIDVARDILAADLSDYEENPDIRVQSVLRSQLQYMAFNTAKKPFDDPRVIEAMRYMFDYEGLSRTVMKGLGVQRNVLVPYGAFGGLNKQEGAPYTFDMDKAKKLLEEAGYADGFSASIYLSTDPISAPLTQHLVQNASKLGVKLNIEQMASSELFSRYRGRNFEAIMSYWSTPLPDAHGMVSRFAANSDNSTETGSPTYPTWRAGWIDPKINEMAKAAIFEQEPDKRIEIYRELQQRHMSSSPFVFLYQLTQNVGLRKEVTSYSAHAFRTYYIGITK